MCFRERNLVSIRLCLAWNNKADKCHMNDCDTCTNICELKQDRQIMFWPINCSCLRRKKKAYLSKHSNSSIQFGLKNLARSYLLILIFYLHVKSMLRCILPSSVYWKKNTALNRWRGENSNGVFWFHFIQMQTIILSFLLLIHYTEKRMVKALGTSFFAIIKSLNFPLYSSLYWVKIIG